MDLSQDVLLWSHIYNIGCRKSFLFALGLIWSFKVAEKRFLNILITHHTTGKMYKLLSSAVFVNSHELITVVYSLAAAFATNNYRGRFSMVIVSIIVCISGLILNFVAENEDKWQLNFWLFYPAMILAHAALMVTLKAFLDDRVRLNYHRGRQHTKFWWTLVSSFTAMGSPFELKSMSLFVVFLPGFIYYHDDGERNESVTSIAKPERQVNIYSLWVCIFILSLVSATGSAFFFLEAITLAGRDCLPVILLLDNVTRVTEFVAAEASSCKLIELKEKKRFNLQKMELLRIGIGMWCCVLCCNFAAGVSTHRKYGAGGGEMSVYWLIPQFFLLGLMRGLAKEGFQSLYESQTESRFKGWDLGELARGAGSILSMLCVFIFNGRHFRWFEKNIGSSKLNKYYSFLAVLSVANAMFYCCVAAWYLVWPFLVKDVKMHTPNGSKRKYAHEDKKLETKSF